jgi:hypothetical protein
MNNSLIEHIRQLNMREKELHNERREKAIERIKEIRERTRTQQETSACSDTSGTIQ